MLNVLKVVGPWVAFRVIWRPFLRHVYRTLVNSYDYKEYDASAITCYVILCCGVAALLLSTGRAHRPLLSNNNNNNNTHLFCPVAIETAGTWNQMAVELVQEIGRRICFCTCFYY